MKTAGYATFYVKAEVILNDFKWWKAKSFHLFFLVIFFEPTTVITVKGQVKDEEPGNISCM